MANVTDTSEGGGWDPLAECIGGGKLFGNTDQNYFNPIATLIIAVFVACGYIWCRRLILLARVLFDNSMKDDTLALARVLKVTGGLPKHVQDALRDVFVKYAPGDMPPAIPSFTALAVALDALAESPESKGSAAVPSTAKPKESADDIELGSIYVAPTTLPPLRASEMTEEGKKVDAWLSWFQKNKESNAVKCEAAMIALLEAKARMVDAPFDREVTQLSMLLSIVVALVVGVDYYWSDWPEGPFYLCQLPYFLSIVTFKPFAVPMWYCLTVAAHVTFVEAIFGLSKDHREESGTLEYSPLPRGPASRAAVLVVQGLFFIWFAAMIIGCLPSLVVFSPLLIVPGFFAPLIAMYIPSAALSYAASQLRRYFSAKEANDPAKEPTAYRSRLAFGETVLILKVAQTQVVSLAMIALPMARFFVGRLTYAEAADYIFGSLDLSLYFSITFAWPVFHLPRFHVYLGLSVGIISFKYLSQLVRAAVAFLEYYLPLLKAPGPWESIANAAFAWVTYHPLRLASDLVRISIEATAATAVGRKDMINLLFGDRVKYYFGGYLGGVIERFPSWMLVLAGPFLVAYALPLTMVFGPNNTDKDVEDWAFDEICLAYERVVCRHKKDATNRTFTAIIGCPWLKRININGCKAITGMFSSNYLTFFKKIIITVRVLHNPLTHLPPFFSPLTNLQSARESFCENSSGDIAVLANCKFLSRFQADGCTGITGTFPGSFFRRPVRLRIVPRKILGDIVVLQHCPNIKEFWGRDTGITGKFLSDRSFRGPVRSRIVPRKILRESFREKSFR